MVGRWREDRQTGRQAGRQADRQRDGQTGRQTEEGWYRVEESPRERERESEREGETQQNAYTKNIIIHKNTHIIYKILVSPTRRQEHHGDAWFKSS